MAPPKLNLPAPANALFERTYRVLEELVWPITPNRTAGRLGGDTTLAARWQHRRSTDIDIAVPVGTGLGRYDPQRDPRLIERMAALGATQANIRFRNFTFVFPDGKLDLVEMDPHLRVGHTWMDVDGLSMEVYDNAQILCGKLEGRGNMLPERDIFDIAVAGALDPAALSAAVNHLESDFRREIVHRIRAQAELYRVASGTVIDLVDPRWRPLLADGPGRAAEAIEAVVYTEVTVAYGERGILLQLGRSDGTTEAFAFRGGRGFLTSIGKLGLEPCFLDVLGAPEAVRGHVDARLALWRRVDRGAMLVDPPYRTRARAAEVPPSSDR